MTRRMLRPELGSSWGTLVGFRHRGSIGDRTRGSACPARIEGMPADSALGADANSGPRRACGGLAAGLRRGNWLVPLTLWSTADSPRGVSILPLPRNTCGRRSRRQQNASCPSIVSVEPKPDNSNNYYEEASSTRRNRGQDSPERSSSPAPLLGPLQALVWADPPPESLALLPSRFVRKLWRAPLSESVHQPLGPLLASSPGSWRKDPRVIAIDLILHLAVLAHPLWVPGATLGLC